MQKHFYLIFEDNDLFWEGTKQINGLTDLGDKKVN